MSPVVVPRDAHTLSRRDIDPDALKVLYRLKDAGFKAYLVGGGVRDLLLGKRPKDFDIGTDAHPQQIKKLFRNAFIIGRRFRLVHVRFGTKVIEVATFRRQIQETDDTPVLPVASAVPEGATVSEQPGLPFSETVSAAPDPRDLDSLHRDNTYGTDEEDAFRRDFTINALFYDIGTFSLIDYVGGLADLKAGVIRCIGEPEVRFHEDPVRMQRAVAFGARLQFELDEPVADAIRWHGNLLATAAPARLMDEYYKILRTGVSARVFAALHEHGLLEVLSPELHGGAATEAFWASLERLDGYRARFDAPPEALTNPVLLGSLITPLGFSHGAWPAWLETSGRPGLGLGVLPLARRDVERLHQLLVLQKRLREPSRSAHSRRVLMQRGSFADALTWLDIHGNAPELLAYWQEQRHSADLPPAADGDEGRPRRRRRSGRHRRGSFPRTP